MVKQATRPMGLTTMVLGSMALALAACGQSETKAVAPDAKAAPDAATAAPVAPTTSEAGEAAPPANLATTPETALAAMQGDWVGVEDPQSLLHVAGNQVTMGYTGDGAEGDTFRLDFVSECEGRPITGPRLGFTLTADDMVLCYTDLEADADNLEYFYAPRGNRQAFRRAGTAAAR